MRPTIIAVACASLLPFSGVASAEVLYTVTDLGTLTAPYNYSSFAREVNASGQVVGSAYTASGGAHGFLYSYCQMIDLKGIGFGNDINDLGQVVGRDYTGGGFLYSKSAKTYLNIAFGGSPTNCIANAINNNGDIVGQAYLPGNSYYHAYIYKDNTAIDLGTLGGDNSSATDLNDSGQVVGLSFMPGIGQRAFLYSGGQMMDLGTFGGLYSAALSINSIGAVVGSAGTTAGFDHAFLFDRGEMIDLGTLGGSISRAVDINDIGQVVGSAYTAHNAEHAFIYSDGSMVDLNSLLIEQPSPWIITRANGINNGGMIVGAGVNAAGQTRAILLMPIPEPSTLVLLSVSAIGLLAYGWRRKRTA